MSSHSVTPLYNKLVSLTLGEGRADEHPLAFTSGPSTAGQHQYAMPRRRRTSPSEDDMKTCKRQRTSLTGSKRRNTESDSFSAKRCIAWFHEYSSAESPDMIGPEGMEKFCEDIGVEPENIVMLSLAWKLEATQMGYFTLAEWLKGMTDLQCDSIAKVQSKIEYLRSLLQDPGTFKSIYRYAFDFAREKDQRSMDIDTAKEMLRLLLGKNWPLFPSFHQFLEEHTKYRVINKDQWFNVLEFSRLIHPDLSNYEEDGAWPVVLDEFVEWYKERQGGEAASSSSSMNSL